MKKMCFLFLVFCLFLIGCGSAEDDVVKGTITEQETETGKITELADLSEKPLIGLTDFCDVSIFSKKTDDGNIYVYIPIAVREDVKNVEIDVTDWNFGGSEVSEALYTEDEEIYDNYRLSCIRLLMSYPEEVCEINSIMLLLDGEPVEYEFGRFYATEREFKYEDENGDNISARYGRSTFEVPQACLNHVPGDAIRFYSDAELTDIRISSDELTIDTEQLQEILTDYYEGDYVEYDLYFTNPDSKYHFFQTACLYKIGQSEEYGTVKTTPTRNKMSKCMKNLLDEKYGTTETE